MLWVSANTPLTFLCTVTAGSPARLGSVLPSEASLQRPQTVQKGVGLMPQTQPGKFYGGSGFNWGF